MKKKDKHVNQDADMVEEIAPGSAEGESGVDVESDFTEEQDDIPEAAISDLEEESGNPLEFALAALAQERDEFKDQALRARAEFDNYRKRMARESDTVRKTAAQGLVRSLLPIVDNLERALNHVEDRGGGLAQGVEMILRQFADVLSAQGLEPIPAKGEPFDPNIHEALTHQPSEEFPADTVMEEFQRGYRLGDYVLRPSQVVVSSGQPAASGTLKEINAEEAPEGTPDAST